MSAPQTIRASMSINRIMDDQATTQPAPHEVKQQAPEPHGRSHHSSTNRQTSPKEDSLQEMDAARTLLSMGQSPQIQAQVPEVNATADVRAHALSSSIDRPSIESSPTGHVRAQGRSPPIGTPLMDLPSLDDVSTQRRSSHFILPPLTFPSMNHAHARGRSHNNDLPTTNFPSMGHARGGTRSLSTNQPSRAMPSTGQTHVAANSSSGILVAKLERLGGRKSKVKSNRVSKKAPVAKKPNPMDLINGGDPEAREFECTYGSPCMLGQYTLELARKMVSDYFGRNKKATAMIEGKWIMSCRKHYQRLSYQVSWPFMKANIVRSQLAEIEQIEPGMAWQIKLKCSEEKRLTDYLHACAQSGVAPDWNSPATKSIPDRKYESPLAVLHSLSAFCGPAKTKKHCDAIITAATEALESGRATNFPLFEMIPQFSSLSKRKRSDTPAPANRKLSKGKGKGKGRLRKKSRVEDEEDDFVVVDDDEDNSEDDDYVMENDVESDSEGA